MWLKPMFRVESAFWNAAGFKSCYIKDEQKEHQQPVLYCLFKPSDDIEGLRINDITDFLDDKVIDLYGYGDNIIVLVLDIPEEFDNDYKLLIKGKYSEVSIDYIDLVDIPTGNEWIPCTLQMMIINKDPLVKLMVENELRQGFEIETSDEYYPSFDMDNEILTKEIIEELINQTV
jgi:hypothetical protein